MLIFHEVYLRYYYTAIFLFLFEKFLRMHEISRTLKFSFFSFFKYNFAWDYIS